ncbi:unnamed protein product [Nippostrongylus brasiliensis]|uniref:Envelope glycoprotein n=1 Tax=Nippostrongylus brasiliensis TaxID=27835 RepID=A0A0N4XSL3_NIPBR|nr:unnamed protein product [Nippostrongylus brasiliensis]
MVKSLYSNRHRRLLQRCLVMAIMMMTMSL